MGVIISEPGEVFHSTRKYYHKGMQKHMLLLICVRTAARLHQTIDATRLGTLFGVGSDLVADYLRLLRSRLPNGSIHVRVALIPAVSAVV